MDSPIEENLLSYLDNSDSREIVDLTTEEGE
jgi:hypothetical protein